MENRADEQQYSYRKELVFFFFFLTEFHISKEWLIQLNVWIDEWFVVR